MLICQQGVQLAGFFQHIKIVAPANMGAVYEDLRHACPPVYTRAHRRAFVRVNDDDFLKRTDLARNKSFAAWQNGQVGVV